MQPLSRILVFLAAATATAVTGTCQDDSVPARPNSLWQFESIPRPHFNGFQAHRQIPDPGAPGSQAHAYDHYSGPSDRFGTWYRPRAATLTQFQRCAPDSFRPRGFGHLFARPYDPYRIDYSPYVLNGSDSLYGPSYMLRMPDPRCEHCDQSGTECDCEHCKHHRSKCK